MRPESRRAGRSFWGAAQAEFACAKSRVLPQHLVSRSSKRIRLFASRSSFGPTTSSPRWPPAPPVRRQVTVHPPLHDGRVRLDTTSRNCVLILDSRDAPPRPRRVGMLASVSGPNAEVPGGMAAAGPRLATTRLPPNRLGLATETLVRPVPSSPAGAVGGRHAQHLRRPRQFGLLQDKCGSGARSLRRARVPTCSGVVLLMSMVRDLGLGPSPGARRMCLAVRCTKATTARCSRGMDAARADYPLRFPLLVCP